MSKAGAYSVHSRRSKFAIFTPLRSELSLQCSWKSRRSLHGPPSQSCNVTPVTTSSLTRPTSSSVNVHSALPSGLVLSRQRPPVKGVRPSFNLVQVSFFASFSPKATFGQGPGRLKELRRPTGTYRGSERGTSFRWQFFCHSGVFSRRGSLHLAASQELPGFGSFTVIVPGSCWDRPTTPPACAKRSRAPKSFEDPFSKLA
mmetsp:Transcript_1301/g.2441  ORF Transcript_1301/g.2441 Transcript_1301/m.2441 type:complete len:201 (-) Transcript_1301:2044-2646(-)